MAQEMTVVRLADVEPLIKALIFYASESSWEAPPGKTRNAKAVRDAGDMARKALLKQPQARIIEVDAWNLN